MPRILVVLLLLAASADSGQAQSDRLRASIDQVMARPAFRHAMFGVKVARLDDDSVIIAINADKLFVPGSTTKLVTVGTALETLGSDFRFHTKVYRTGPIGADGTLNGDLVLVASGDPNLSHRAQGDSLLFVDEDHSYGNDPTTDLIPGDPLQALRALASQVRAKGVRRLVGSVRVDASLFDANQRELGTGVMISPIVLNDNIVDLIVTPGRSVAAAATLRVSPVTGYLKVINRTTTGPAEGPPTADVATDSLLPDGTQLVVLTGIVPLGGHGSLITYKVPDPARYAAEGLRRALTDAGVKVGPRRASGRATRPYRDDQLVAEWVSPPFREAAKVILKVSQNLHASMMPFVLGALRGTTPTAQGGFDVERKFLESAGLDPSGAVQSDGAGGAALYTPDFMVSFLTYLSKQKSAGDFLKGLPILGKDGTLAKISVGAPAAGSVFAKTGTFVSGDLLNRGLVVDGKGLAGYLTTRSGKRLVFAVYINRVKVANGAAIQELVGQAAGDIAAAVYDAVP